MHGKMKRLLILVSAIGFILLAMTACGGGATEAPTIEPAATEPAAEEPATDVVVPTDTAEAPSPTATAVPATATSAPPTETATTEPTPEPTSTPTDEPTPEPTAAATTEPATDTPPQPSRAGVSIAGFQFSPGTLTVAVVTTVVWTNNESARHTVTADDGSFGSGTLAEGDVFEFTFDTPGTYAYYCRFHGGAGGDGMSGVITVTE